MSFLETDWAKICHVTVCWRYVQYVYSVHYLYSSLNDFVDILNTCITNQHLQKGL